MQLISDSLPSPFGAAPSGATDPPGLAPGLHLSHSTRLFSSTLRCGTRSVQAAKRNPLPPPSSPAAAACLLRGGCLLARQGCASTGAVRLPSYVDTSNRLVAYGARAGRPRRLASLGEDALENLRAGGARLSSACGGRLSSEPLQGQLAAPVAAPQPLRAANLLQNNAAPCSPFALPAAGTAQPLLGGGMLLEGDEDCSSLAELSNK